MFKFLFESKFLGFVEAPVGVFLNLSTFYLSGWVAGLTMLITYSVLAELGTDCALVMLRLEFN